MPSKEDFGSAVRGYRLLPSLLDHIAATDPTRVLYSFSKTPNPADGFLDVDALSFARAVNRCAWYIEKQLGRAGDNFPTLTYMGPQDLVYGVLIIACIKAGYKLLLNSPRNSLEAHLRLFDQTNCNTFLLPPVFPLPVIKQILSKRKMQVVDIPGIQCWLSDEPVDIYPYNKTFDEAKHEPFVVLHTSGSTGWPKPVVQTHGTHAPLDAYPDLPQLGFKPAFPATCAGTRLYMAYPLFHCAGVVILLAAAIYNEVTIVLASFPPSADVANGVHTYGNVHASCVPTTVLIELCKESEHLENLARLDFVMFGGGPCPPAVGDLARTKTRITSALGTTEAGVIPNQMCDPEDWAYLSFSPALGSEYRHHSDDLYEHFIVRSDKYERFQGIFRTLPSIQEWPMKDLYSKHPTKANVWLYRGRTDDIIVYHTGEKLNPLGMEDIIASHPAISAALVAGHGKFQSSLLIEAVTVPKNDAARRELLDTIWPSIEAANKEAPSHACIHRDMVLFTAAEKPMLKAGKGTVQRKMTIDLYQPELDALYAAAESSAVAEHDGFIRKPGSISQAVITILQSSTNIDVRSTTPLANLFELGLDSLQATQISRHLNRLLSQRGKPQTIKPRDIYSNPSVEGLVNVVTALIDDGEVVTREETDEERIQCIYDQLSNSLPVTVRPVKPSPEKHTVLLTGSTGSLGGYILEILNHDPRVSRIYCLNRGPDSALRQKETHAKKGFSPTLEKAVLVDADFSRSLFGLPLDVYRQLLAEVTCVIHNAWQVDFNLGLTSFTAHTARVRQFIDFSAHSCYGAHIVFISSISTVSAFDISKSSSAAVPELIFDNWHVSQKTGYGQSKLIAERLLGRASKEANVRTTVCRVGQIAGPTTESGMWPRQEWLPSLITSSKYLGKLPESLGQMETVDWTPVDRLAHIIADLSLEATSHPISVNDQPLGASVYHLVNPNRTTWSALLPTVTKHLSASGGRPVETVPLASWIDALRQSMAQTDDLTLNPAVKILDFFEGLFVDAGRPVVLDTTHAQAASKSLTDVGPVTNTWMKNWLRQWDAQS